MVLPTIIVKPDKYSLGRDTSRYYQPLLGTKTLSRIGHNIGAIAQVPIRAFTDVVHNPEIIDLNDNVTRVTPDTNDLSSILTNDFVEDNPNNIRYARDFINTTDTLIGDRKIPLSRISQYYGVEDGKLKIGSPGDFNPLTTIVPVRNKNVGRIYGIDEIKPNSKHRYYQGKAQEITHKIEDFLFKNYGFLSHERYTEECNKVRTNIPIIGSLWDTIYPYSGVRKLFRKQEKAMELYNKDVDSNSSRMRVLKDLSNKLESVGDSVLKYQPGTSFITDRGRIDVALADFSRPGNFKTLFASPTGEGSFFAGNLFELVRNPKTRKELNKRFRENTLYPIKVDNGRYSGYQTVFPSYESYTSGDFMRDPKTMYVLGTKKK